MGKLTTNAYRPRLEPVEDRCLAAGHSLTGHLIAGNLHRTAHVVRVSSPVRTAAIGAHHNSPTVAAAGKAVVFARPGAGSSGRLPSSFRDWGVITIWNTTSRRVTFSIAASTYRNGQYFNFTLKPGQYQAYYASFNGIAPPSFNVSFDTLKQFNSTLISDMNVVFQSGKWIPKVGTEGRPYAITENVSGLGLTPI